MSLAWTSHFRPAVTETDYPSEIEGGTMHALMMNRPVVRTFLSLMLLATIAVPSSAIDGYSTAPFRAGEVLRYTVKWKFFRLGTVVFEQHAAPDDPDGSRAYELRMIGDSSPGLPFVNVHFTNRSLLSPRDPFNRAFTYECRGENPIQLSYSSHDPSPLLYMAISRSGRLVFEDSIPHQRPVYDADGLFMAARCFSKSGYLLIVPTIVDRKIRDTRVRFTGEMRTIKVPALPGGVAARRIDGDADWATGSCAGLTGRFKGWVTDDARAIPLKIEMEIAIGSVVLELESVTRPDESSSESVKMAADASIVLK